MMRRSFSAVALALMIAPATAGAQASQFGIRGLGLPTRGLSARALSLGGSSGMFDGESSVNPAALITLASSTALFTSSGAWTSSTNPLATQSLRDTRFPQILLGGPIPGKPLAIGVSYSMYTDRDFTVVSDGVAAPRGVNVIVHDTLSSRGGIDDLRLGVAWRLGAGFAIGGGFHFITGSNRLSTRRYWEDTTYRSPVESTELSYKSTGISLGALWQPVRQVQVAGTFRRDARLSIDRDSTGVGQLQLPSAPVGTVELPTTISGGIRFAPSTRFALTGSVISRNWSVADSGLKAQGAPGARNTFEINGGLEFYRDSRRANKYPLRFGFRSATLPFLLESTPQPKETAISFGTGRRFAADRGGFDIALQRVWRSQGSGYTESAWIVTIGLSVRPGGLTP